MEKGIQTDTESGKLAYSVAEFAKACGLSRSRLYALWALNEGPERRKFGGRTLIPAAAGRAWFEQVLAASRKF